MSDIVKVVSVLTPKKIYDEVSKTIVGQHKAKKLVSNALYLHVVRLFKLADELTVDPYAKMDSKSNVLLMGPSGCGKTFLVRETARAVRNLTGLDIFNLLEIDATGLTAKGWKGDDIEDHIGNFYTSKLRGNKDLFNTSIIYIDEFDKKIMPSIGQGGTDHNKEVQFALLKLSEGKDVDIKSGFSDTVTGTVNTSTVLFIFSGSFEDVRKNRKDTGSKLGFTYNNLRESADSLHNALMEIGLIPELAGRIGFAGEIEQLTKEELLEILIEHVVPRSAELLGRIGINVEEQQDLFEHIADVSLSRKTGARGLDVELFTALEDKIFNSSINL